MLDKNNSEQLEIKMLKEISKMFSGYAFKSSDFISKGVPVIKISNIGYSNFIWKGQQYLNQTFLNRCEDYRIFPGDILIALTRPITNDTTKVCKYPSNAQIGLLNQRVACIRESYVEKDFLFWYFQTQTFKSYIRSKFSETLQPNLSPKDLEFTPIPFFAPCKQKAIVSKIEELFSELDKGIEQLKTAQQQLKTYRQAVLKWAFEGKLTEKWREESQDIKSASELLSAVKRLREAKAKEHGKKLKLISSFTEEEQSKLTVLPSQWIWVKIVETVFNTADDIVDGPFGSNLKNSDFVEGASVPVIGISNIEEGFEKKIRYITEEKFETIKRSAVYPGDIIVAKIGSTYGKTGFYPEWMPIGVIPANLLRVRPSNHFSKKLLIYYLKSAVFKKKLDSIMKSTAQPAYNVSMFKDLPIPFMTIEEQNEIVQEIESRLSVADKMEESISQSLQQSEALRQSILKKAFEGKLI